MKFFAAIASLSLILGWALGAVFEQQSLVLKPLGGKRGELTAHGKLVVVEDFRSKISTTASLQLEPVGKKAKPFVRGNAVIAIAQGGKDLHAWIFGDQATVELEANDAVLLVTGTDTANMEDAIEFGNVAFNGGEIRQDMIDSNKTFSVAIYKVISEDESQTSGDIQSIKSTNDSTSNSPPTAHRHGPFVLEHVGGQEGMAHFMEEPRLVQLKIASTMDGHGDSMAELRMRGTKLELSGSGRAVVYLFRAGERSCVFNPENGKLEEEVKAGDVVLVAVWNQKANKREILKLVSSAISKDKIKSRAFKASENHTVMAFKIAHRDVAPRNFRDGPLALEKLEESSQLGQLDMSSDFALLADWDAIDSPSMAKVGLKGAKSEFSVLGKALIELYRGKGLERIFYHKNSLNTTCDVQLDDIIQLSIWKSQTGLDNMAGSALDPINDYGMHDMESYVSFRVVLEQEEQSKKRKSDQDVMLPPIVRDPPASVTLRLSDTSDDSIKVDSNFGKRTFDITTLPYGASCSFVNIEIVKKNIMHASLINNAYLFVIRNDEIINRILPGEYCNATDFLQNGDRIVVFIHKHELTSDEIKIKLGDSLFGGIYNSLCEAGYSYVNFKVI